MNHSNPHITALYHTPHDSHCRQRMSELTKQGYRVELYCYSRQGHPDMVSEDYPVHILGDLSRLSYAKRIGLYLRTLSRVIRQSPSGVMYYLYGLDLALVFRLLAPGRPYIYEEADMMHMEAGITHRWLATLLEWADRCIIRHAQLAVLTSPGYCRYHFGDRVPANICIAPNLLDPAVEQYPVHLHQADSRHLRFGFVGMIRYRTVYLMLETIGQHYPQHEVHLYGPRPEHWETLNRYSNIHWHGPFANPDDLARIYSEIDLLICTYDVWLTNVQYLEPNKLYESIYYRTPIVVSAGTYAAERVEALQIGYVIEADSADNIIQWIDSLTDESIRQKQEQCARIDRCETINSKQTVSRRIQTLLTEK